MKMRRFDFPSLVFLRIIFLEVRQLALHCILVVHNRFKFVNEIRLQKNRHQWHYYNARQHERSL